MHPCQVADCVATAWSEAHVQVVVVPGQKINVMLIVLSQMLESLPHIQAFVVSFGLTLFLISVSTSKMEYNHF